MNIMSEGAGMRLGKFDDEEGEFEAHVFIPLFSGDIGRGHSRSGRPEFVNRKPVGVVGLNASGAKVIVSNSGILASDVITLDWRVRFCTFGGHLPHEGFTHDHAGEAQSLKSDFARLDFLDAGKSHSFDIQFPEHPENLENVYFQARVYTLWSPNMAPDEWTHRFETDPQITEAHFKP